MSQSSLDQSQSQNPPKRFLKKGEGLKRFHAYNPPLPSTQNKIRRRQTFVKFKLENEKSTKGLTSYPLPETVDPFKVPEFPRKPKTERTPIRPNRQALGTLKASTFNIEPTNHYHETSHEHQLDTSIDLPPHNSTPTPDLSTPSPGSGLLALGKQIEQLQATVNDLKAQVSKCRCGFGLCSPKRIVTRASARRAQKAKANDDNGPSANADNSTTPVIVKKVSGDVARLKDMFDEMNLLK